jgi:hypothetical protein
MPIDVVATNPSSPRKSSILEIDMKSAARNEYTPAMDDKKPEADPHSLRPRQASASVIGGLRKSLFGNLLLLVLVMAGAILVVILWGSQRTVLQVSRSLIDATSTRIHAELSGLFDPVRDNLLTARDWGEAGQLPVLDVDVLNALFMPVLRQNPQISSVILANAVGDEYLLLRDDKQWINRLTRAERWQGRSRWQTRSDQGQLVDDEWRQSDYDPRSRPWYTGASSRPSGLLNWTDPYAFFTTGEPGITASVRFTSAGSEMEYVLALDVLLKDISKFTTRFEASESSSVVVLTADGRLVGLPSMDTYQDESAIARDVLSPAESIAGESLRQAVANWREDPSGYRQAERLLVSGQPYWVSFTPFDLGSKRRLWIGVTVPESDFLGDVRLQNLALLGVTVGGLAAALLLGWLTDRTFNRRVGEQLSRVQQLGQYTLEEKLGSGGWGSVYKAHHALLRRPTAIKLLHPEKEGDEDALARFEREVQLTSRLTHPNTVAIYDYGRTPDGIFYYAMEYFAGVDLKELIHVYGPVPPDRAIFLLKQVCYSLAEAHSIGLIHRDIKPANLMLCERGGQFDVIKVVDFGMVKDLSVSGADRPELTQENKVMGTPHYLPPESIRKQTLDGRSDLYALGAVAYFMLTGRRVFEGDNAIDVARQHLEEQPLPPSTHAPGLPSDLEAIVMSCLEKDPALRPSNALEMVDLLDDCADAGKWTKKRAAEWWARVAGENQSGATKVEPLDSDQTLRIDFENR